MKTKEIEKKAFFQVERKSWPFCSQFIEHDRCQKTIYNGPTSSLTSFVHAIRSFLQDLRSREPIFSKKVYLTSNKKVLPSFNRIIECDKPQGKLYTSPHISSDNYCQSNKIISLGTTKLSKTQFFGKRRQSVQ